MEDLLKQLSKLGFEDDVVLLLSGKDVLKLDDALGSLGGWEHSNYGTFDNSKSKAIENGFYGFCVDGKTYYYASINSLIKNKVLNLED